MDVKYQRQNYIETQHAVTRDRMVRVLTDYNGGMSAKDIAKREGISRAWVYALLRKARTEPIS